MYIYIYVNARVCLLVLLYNLLAIHVCVFVTAICIKTLFAQMVINVQNKTKL